MRTRKTVLTKRVFELIARTVSQQYSLALTEERRGTVRELAYAIAYDLRYANSAFDSSQFLRACGVSE